MPIKCQVCGSVRYAKGDRHDRCLACLGSSHPVDSCYDCMSVHKSTARRRLVQWAYWLRLGGGVDQFPTVSEATEYYATHKEDRSEVPQVHKVWAKLKITDSRGSNAEASPAKGTGTKRAKSSTKGRGATGSSLGKGATDSQVGKTSTRKRQQPSSSSQGSTQEDGEEEDYGEGEDYRGTPSQVPSHLHLSHTPSAKGKRRRREQSPEYTPWQPDDHHHMGQSNQGQYDWYGQFPGPTRPFRPPPGFPPGPPQGFYQGYGPQGPSPFSPAPPGWSQTAPPGGTFPYPTEARETGQSSWSQQAKELRRSIQVDQAKERQEMMEEMRIMIKGALGSQAPAAASVVPQEVEVTKGVTTEESAPPKPSGSSPSQTQLPPVSPSLPKGTVVVGSVGPESPARSSSKDSREGSVRDEAERDEEEGEGDDGQDLDVGSALPSVVATEEENRLIKILAEEAGLAAPVEPSKDEKFRFRGSSPAKRERTKACLPLGHQMKEIFLKINQGVGQVSEKVITHSHKSRFRLDEASYALCMPRREIGQVLQAKLGSKLLPPHKTKSGSIKPPKLINKTKALQMTELDHQLDAHQATVRVSNAAAWACSSIYGQAEEAIQLVKDGGDSQQVVKLLTGIQDRASFGRNAVQETATIAFRRSDIILRSQKSMLLTEGGSAGVELNQELRAPLPVGSIQDGVLQPAGWLSDKYMERQETQYNAQKWATKYKSPPAPKPFTKQSSYTAPTLRQQFRAGQVAAFKGAKGRGGHFQAPPPPLRPSTSPRHQPSPGRGRSQSPRGRGRGGGNSRGRGGTHLRDAAPAHRGRGRGF